MSRRNRRRKKEVKTIIANPRPKIKGWQIIIFFGLIVGVFVVSKCIQHQKDDQRRASLRSSNQGSALTSKNTSELISADHDLWLKRFNLLIDGYHSLHSQTNDQWWLDSDPKTVSDLALINKKAIQISTLIQRFATTSELAGKIAAQFQKPICEFRQGNNLLPLTFDFVDRQNKKERSITVGPKQFPLIFLPRNRKDIFGSSIAFEYEDIMFVRTVDCPEAIYAGLLFHELGHLSKSGERKKQKLPDLADDSPEEIAEEIMMYQFGHQIINAATNNFYDYQIREIIERIEPADWSDLLPQIELSDLVELDQIVGADNRGWYIGNLIGSLHLMNIALAVCDSEFEKESVYRYLVMDQ